MFRVETVTTGLGGSPYYTRVHFGDEEDTTSGGAAAAHQRMTAFWEFLAEGATPKLTDVNITVQTEVTVVDVATGQPTDVIVVPPSIITTGTSGNPGPLPVQGLVQLTSSTYRRGRRVRGKIFVPGIDTSNNSSNGRPGQSLIDALTAAGNTLWQDLGTPAPAVIYSRPVEGGGPGVVSPVTGAAGWSQWAVLRSRRD